MGRTILIVDDDSRNIFALSAVLRAKEFNTISASGMNEAFALLNKHKEIGIVLLDIMMPEMDGLEAIPALKSEHKNIPVIAVTAQAMKGDRERCLDAGADDYIPKPVDVDLLCKILNEHLK